MRKLIDKEYKGYEAADLVQKILSCSRSHAKRLLKQRGVVLLKGEQVLKHDLIYAIHKDEEIRIGRNYYKLVPPYTFTKYQTSKYGYEIIDNDKRL